MLVARRPRVSGGVGSVPSLIATHRSDVLLPPPPTHPPPPPLPLLPLSRQAGYTTLREAEYRSTYPIPYWNLAPLRWLVPRQRRNADALGVISDTLDELIAKCKKLVRC